MPLEVLLTYECDECGRAARVRIERVAVKDLIAVEGRLPELWIHSSENKAAILCPACSKKTPNFSPRQP